MNTMLDTKKMSVEEIRKYIVQNHNVKTDVVENIKGKSKLVDYLNNLENGGTVSELLPGGCDVDDNIFEGFDMKVEKTPSHSISQVEPEIPNITDPNWTEFALNQLTDDEKSEGYPKADGLRRLVEKLISPIKNIDTTVVQAPQNGNNMTSTVKTTIYLSNGSSYSACTDVQKDDCPSPYNKHISAVAETRAEGRAYRKILRLKNVVTKEELVAEDPLYNNDKMSAAQIAFFNAMCGNKKLNINVVKLFNSVFPNSKVNSIKDYSKDQILKVSEIVSDYQEDINKIPNEILGYDPNWLI